MARAQRDSDFPPLGWVGRVIWVIYDHDWSICRKMVPHPCSWHVEVASSERRVPLRQPRVSPGNTITMRWSSPGQVVTFQGEHQPTGQFRQRENTHVCGWLVQVATAMTAVIDIFKLATLGSSTHLVLNLSSTFLVRSILPIVSGGLSSWAGFCIALSRNAMCSQNKPLIAVSGRSVLFCSP